MKVVDTLLSANKSLKFVKAVFWPNIVSQYTYKTYLDFEADDFAVVQVKNEYKVVRIVSVSSFDEIVHDIDYSKYSIKWIVQRIDFEEFDASVEAEASLLTELKKAKNEAERKAVINSLVEELGQSAVKKLTKLVRL